MFLVIFFEIEIGPLEGSHRDDCPKFYVCHISRCVTYTFYAFNFFVIYEGI